MASGLKFRLKEVEGLYYLSSGNIVTDQLHSYRRAAQLICVFVYAYAKSWFSHDAVHVSVVRENRKTDKECIL